MLEDIRQRSNAYTRSRIVRNATVYERYTVERAVLGNGLSGYGFAWLLWLLFKLP